MAATHHFHAHKLFSVKDYVCVVTGGGTGIGLMAAQALAANGAKVYITGRRPEALAAAARAHDPNRPEEGQILPLPTTDVTSKEDLERCVRAVSEKESHVDLLVCAAGIPGPKTDPSDSDAKGLSTKLWENESFQQWADTWNTDVTAVYFTTVAFLPLMQAGIAGSETEGNGASDKGRRNRFGPSVITISSMSGEIRHAQSHFAYNAAKGGTVHLTKLMSSEFSKTGVRVNSISPGYFPSEMTAKGSSDDRQKSVLPDESVKEKGHVPAMRPGREEEMGMAVLFLAKNEYVNGQILTVDGGVLNVISS